MAEGLVNAVRLTKNQQKILYRMSIGHSLKTSSGDDPGRYHITGNKWWQKDVVQERTFKKLFNAGYIYLGIKYGRSTYMLTPKGVELATWLKD